MGALRAFGAGKLFPLRRVVVMGTTPAATEGDLQWRANRLGADRQSSGLDKRPA